MTEVNYAWYGSGIIQNGNIDVCVAVSIDEGLITPIVKIADNKGLLQISSEINELAQKARYNKLSTSEYEGGSFTISNLGMYGVLEFCAIINPPQAAILAVGAVREVAHRSEMDEAKVVFMKIIRFTLSCDHRIVDGAVAAKWMS